jgi:hypothetical protein
MVAMVFGTASVFVALAQGPAAQQKIDVTARLQLSGPTPSARRQSTMLPPAVLWLQPLTPGLILPAIPQPHGGYVLLQKNKMFSPHLLVVPTGSVVLFPNADPFFHNVFSLFDGQRFDLGLYEAGKTKIVSFSREGASYIFCDIHPDMSAVVIALSTPLYSIAEKDGFFHLHNVPQGDYEMHVWVEGEQQTVMNRWMRRVHISSSDQNLGTITLDSPLIPTKHTDKFGQPYDTNVKPPY